MYVVPNMKDCLFCKLISGEFKAHTVYEDNDVFAFLDINPINTGHTLVIPKKHVVNFHEMDDKVYDKVMKIVKKLSQQINETFHPKKVGLMVMGWDVPHAHIHVVPMEDYHDITSKKYLESQKNVPSQEELAQTAEKLKKGTKRKK